MKKLLVYIIAVSILASCQSKAAKNGVKTDTAKAIAKPNKAKIGVPDLPPQPSSFDTILKPFSDKSYQFAIHMDSLDAQTLDPNSTFTFKRVQAGKTQIIFKHKAFCGFPIIELRDMDNDGIKDIMIYGEVAGRGANEYYHLYLVDKLHHNLINVKGFDGVVTPVLDEKTNIITSLGLSGSKYYSFYRINKQHHLINLGHGFEEDPKDENEEQYQRAIKAIIKQYGK